MGVFALLDTPASGLACVRCPHRGLGDAAGKERLQPGFSPLEGWGQSKHHRLPAYTFERGLPGCGLRGPTASGQRSQLATRLSLNTNLKERPTGSRPAWPLRCAAQQCRHRPSQSWHQKKKKRKEKRPRLRVTMIDSPSCLLGCPSPSSYTKVYLLAADHAPLMLANHAPRMSLREPGVSVHGGY